MATHARTTNHISGRAPLELEQDAAPRIERYELLDPTTERVIEVERDIDTGTESYTPTTRTSLAREVAG